ncbi:MAG: nuclease-related domain-containing protein [Trueperaceae bacterium]
MAKLYFCNNGDIELQPETLSILSGMPRGWNVLLNARPANPGGYDREVDALIVKESAVHLIEFKFRRYPVVIDAEGYWHSGGSRMENTSRRESPQEQVLATHDAFKQWLANRGLPKFGLAPWVVLENPNPENRYGGARFGSIGMSPPERPG